jgi:cysteine desulfurase/selenocysteine lyase
VTALAKVRAEFPFFAANADVVYLDSAATTQKPSRVIDAVADQLGPSCATVGRSGHRLARSATAMVHAARQEVAAFLGAEPADLAFTSGATESLNIIAFQWGMGNLRDGDEVMVCLDDHAAAVKPWLEVRSRLGEMGVDVSVVPFDSYIHGDYDTSDLASKLSPRTRLVAVSHVHHISGMEMELARLRTIIPADVAISIDAAQSVGHIPVDVRSLGVDFVSFSGHKMFASPGVGALWAHPARRPEMRPARVGAASTGEFRTGRDDALATIVEAGTPNIVGIRSMLEAVRFIGDLGIERIEARLLELTQRLLSQLRSLPNIRFTPGPAHCPCAVGHGILSFAVQGVSSLDVGFVLDSQSICVRAGGHCLPVPGRDLADAIRVSLHVYNTEQEIDRFVLAMSEIAA